MKLTRATTSLVIAAAVLLAAYAAGRVIRSMRSSPTVSKLAPAEPAPKQTARPVEVEKVEIQESRPQEVQASRETAEPEKAPVPEKVEKSVPPPVPPEANPVKAAADDPFGFMGVNVSPKLRAMLLEKWNAMSDDEKEEAKKSWTEMPEEQKQQAITALESMDKLP